MQPHRGNGMFYRVQPGGFHHCEPERDWEGHVQECFLQNLQDWRKCHLNQHLHDQNLQTRLQIKLGIRWGCLQTWHRWYHSSRADDWRWRNSHRKDPTALWYIQKYIFWYERKIQGYFSSLQKSWKGCCWFGYFVRKRRLQQICQS